MEMLLQGLLLGGLYGLFALGLSLMFGVMRLTNTAHGDFIMLGSFSTFALVTLGLSPWFALIAVLPLAWVCGYVHLKDAPGDPQKVYDFLPPDASVVPGHGVAMPRDGLLWHLAYLKAVQSGVKDALAQGKPLPMAFNESRVWGVKEKLMERALPLLRPAQLAQWLQDAHTVDGIVKGLKQPDWPQDGWQALQRLALQVCRLTQAAR